jgi:hypothetical protein
MLAREGPDAVAPLLAPSVGFDSAALRRPFVGKEAVLRLLPVLRDDFEDVEITDEFTAANALPCVFSGRIGGRDVTDTETSETSSAPG